MGDKAKRRVRVHAGNPRFFKTGFVLSETDTTIRIRVNRDGTYQDLVFDKATKSVKSKVKNWFPLHYVEM